MEIRTGSVLFESLRGGGPRSATSTIAFNRPVQRAVAGLVGYTAGFRGGDHHVGELDVGVDTAVDGSNAVVTARLGVRDWSGTWDDDYAGVVQFVVLADLEPIAPPGTQRLDLRVTGIEITQATQHFRSTLGTDNSIRLLARKSTALRVYVDYDASAGLPPISALAGEVEVTTSIGTTTFTLAPVRSITPRRDVLIDRAQVDHTLNFLIPEAWCQGELSIRCQVFDAATPAQRSPAFERVLRFVDVAPLRVYGVGVHYTGQGLDLAAPTQTDVMTTLSFAETTYPVGEVELTGYLAHDFDDDLRADIDDGCGDGFNSLLDDLRDLRAGSTDVYYGVLPSGGIDSGSVGGCGGGGVGAGFVNGGSTAAQEIGHAFGRDHAPCDDETRCGDPAHQDESYPDYSPFPSDSIGEFGYDTRSHDVKPPDTFFDFMGYSGPDWVSPYTYEGLMTRFPASSGTGGSPSASRLHRQAYEAPVSRVFDRRAEWIRREMPTLFLWLDIDRSRRVQRLPSFHFETQTRTRGRETTPFTVELHDAEGRVLSCHRLRSECRHCGDDCWPKRIREQIPYPDGAARLVVREDDEVIHDEPVGDPPKLHVAGKYDKKTDRVRLTWTCEAGAKRSGRGKGKDGGGVEEECWYLVHYLDDRGVWRGLLPRTRDTELWLPARLAARRDVLPLRVLASSGIATTAEVVELQVPTGPAPPSLTVAHLEPSGTEQPALRRTLSVGVLDELGRSVADADIVWYDDRRSEMGRGRTLDLSQLPQGQHVLYPAVLGTAEVGNLSGVLVDRSEEGLTSVHTGLTPEQEAARDTHSHHKYVREDQEGT